MPANHHRPRSRTILTIVLVFFVTTAVFSSTARPAQAILGVGDVVGVISDIPAVVGRALEKAYRLAKGKIKIATDIAFKNSTKLFLGRVVQEAAIQLATTGPGQKPLFLTNPQTFFRDVSNAAAGDFIDGFQRGLTGGSLNSQGLATGGQVFGRNRDELFSDAQQRFIISRILRASAGDPVQSCQEQCRVNYAVRNTNITSLGSLGAMNDHERNIAIVTGDIKKTEAAVAIDKNAPYPCPDIVQAPLVQKYLPFEIYISNTPWLGLTAEVCLAKQKEAINTEWQKARDQLNPCLKECREGVPGAALQAINSFTATDIFSAVDNADPRQAPAAIANSLSRSKSGIGQLLGAAGALTATVQERVLGEDTKLKAGVLPKTSPVSKKVQTPKEATSALFGVPFYNSEGQLTYTGTGVADILKGIASFLNSPIGRALTTYFKSKCGLNPDSCKGPSNATSTFGQLLFGDGKPSGIAGAQLQFATLAQPELITGDPGRSEVSIVDELTANGLIDAQFRSAIESQITVREALAKNLLDPNKTFGFDQNGIEPRSGYPYRALQYLRKYRVIPVGWELAAKYSQSFGHRPLSLGFLSAAFNLCGQDDQHKVCTGGSAPDKSCTADIDCGVDLNGKPGRCQASPYCGLVDPDWVLKAPQTYCRRLGAGEEIVNREFVCDQNNVDGTPGTGGGLIKPGEECTDPNANPVQPGCHDIKAPNCIKATGNDFPDIGRWIIERNSDTCADVQSCIAENEDGTCQGYGYCVQERQTFKFNGTQCSAEYASCTTYVDENGQNVSYLSRTLDFRDCTAENAGCEEYATSGTCSVSGDTCFADDDCGSAGGSCAGIGSLRFTGQVGRCSQSQVGCRQFIRTAGGSNLLSNPGFETITSGGPVDSGNAAVFAGWNPGPVSMIPITSDDTTVAAGNSIAVNGQGNGTISQVVNGGVSLYEQSFTASIRAKSASGCSATIRVTAAQGGPSLESSSTVSPSSNWQTFSTTLTVPPANVVTVNNNLVTFSFDTGACGGPGFVLDSAQLEVGSSPTAYKDYGVVNNIFLNGTRQQCTTEDVGCELYAPIAGGPSVTAVARNSNRCSADDVGCAAYHIEPITTMPQRPAADVTVVATRGQQCSAADVGCEEYTNLDLAAQGGEAREYFKAIKQCVKPSGDVTKQVPYYTWVGDPDSGFILRAYTLLKSEISGAPCTNVQPSGSACSDGSGVVASCSQAELATNPDCAEYYDSALTVYYRLRSRTVSVTDNCHPYRNTIDSLIYYLSPQENTACGAGAASCRAYTGNSGHTTRQVFRDTFEPGTTANWVGGTPSSASVNLGGHSMKFSNTVFTTSTLTQGEFTKGKSYLVTFTAAAVTAAQPTVTASLGTANGNVYQEDPALLFSGSAVAKWNTLITPSGPEWNTYTLGPLTMVNDPASDQRLALKTTGDVYVDNVTLTEITDSLYLVSSSVPACPASEVGCAAYRDRQRQLQYFKSFTRICSEQVVGCEALIDTQNSSTPLAQTVKGVTTPADTMVTFVNNPRAYCPASAKGCDVFGRASYLQDYIVAGYKPIYLKNDPDTHSRDLCLANEVSCKIFGQGDGGAVFFKDPVNRSCEFQTGTGTGGGQWVISGTNYKCPVITPPQSGRPVGASCAMVCDGVAPPAGTSIRAGKPCVDANDCPLTAGGTAACLGDASKVGKIIDGGVEVFGQCPDANGANNCAGTNTCVYLAGTCPEEQDGCNEYRDPTDPKGCRSECPLQLQGASPIYMDSSCAVTRCQGGPNDQQNCQDSGDCGGGFSCVGSSGSPASGVPGCRSYFYLRQSIEGQAAECNGQINLATGCRPFNDTSNPTLNFRGQ